MNKRGWFIPIFIVSVNVLAIIVQWSSLSDVFPAHFDLQGNPGGEMSRNVLLMYPIISAVVSLAAYLTAKIKDKLQTGLIILATGIALVILFSTMVTLTSGTMPVFMLAEPVILLAAVVGFVICFVKSRKTVR